MVRGSLWSRFHGSMLQSSLCFWPREAALFGVNNDPLLSSPSVSQGEPSRPQSPKASAPTSEELTSLPPYSPIYPKLPAEKKPSPVGHTWSRASHLTTTPVLLPLREVAATEGSIQVHVHFSIIDLQQCQDRLRNFSEDPSCFTSNFQALILAFDMSWRDLYIIFDHLFLSTRKATNWGRGLQTCRPITCSEPQWCRICSSSSPRSGFWMGL